MIDILFDWLMQTFFDPNHVIFLPYERAPRSWSDYHEETCEI